MPAPRRVVQSAFICRRVHRRHHAGSRLRHVSSGLLAVRVARSISEFFGGGTLTSSEGATGEPAIFGNRAAWVDDSGPVGVGQGNARQTQTEGITFFDRPANPHSPSRWHVRADGWMGASFCFDEAWPLTQDSPLTLRYLLYAHRGGTTLRLLTCRPPFTLAPAGRPGRLDRVSVIASGSSSEQQPRSPPRPIAASTTRPEEPPSGPRDSDGGLLR